MTRMTISIQGGADQHCRRWQAGWQCARALGVVAWSGSGMPRRSHPSVSSSSDWRRVMARASNIDWPFASTRAVPAAAKVDEVDCEVKDAEKFVGRPGADPGIFKYRVEVTPVAPNPPVPALDPVIIIRD